MKRWIVWGVVLIVLNIVGVYRPVSAASSGASWAEKTIVKIKQGPAGAPNLDSATCSGVMMPIETTSSDGTTTACVFGQSDGIRLARLRGGLGQYVYAVAFPTEVTYAVLRDFCVGLQFCGYGQSEDVALVQQIIPSGMGYGQTIVKNFSKHITAYPPDTRYLQYTPDDTPLFVATESQAFLTESIGLSAHGRWAIVELQSFGLVRIDLRTLHMQRIRAPGSNYGLGSDPLFEITITDDGSKVAVTGFRAAVDVYEVDNQCGDDLAKGRIDRTFSAYTTPCRVIPIDSTQLPFGYESGHTPHFSADGKRLSVVFSMPGWTMFEIFSPEPEGGDGDTFGYLAFGDSFTSGEGEVSDAFYLSATNTTHNRCHVSTRSYPYLVGKWWELVTQSYACSGSQIPDVLAASARALEDEHARVKTPQVISLGVGGNDVELVGKLKSCLGVGTCEWALPSRRAATAEEIRALFPKMVDLITTLKNNYSQAPIVVVGYPRVINTTSTACNAFVSLALTPDERRYFDESIMYVNRILHAAAQSAQATYVDIEDALVGERLCDSTESAMNGVRLGDDIAPISLLGSIKVIGAESFHPTPRGHQRITQVIQEKLKDFWQSPYCTSCQFTDEMLTPSPYWTETEPSPPLRQIARRFMYATELQSHLSQQFHFPAGTFPVGAKVRLEIHSEPIELGEFTAEEDGSLSGAVILPDTLQGYHTMHALLVNESGSTTDWYEAVHIQNVPTDTSPVASNAASLLVQGSQPPLQNRHRGSSQRKFAAITPKIGDVLGVATSSPRAVPADVPQKQATVLGKNHQTVPLKLPGILLIVAICLAIILGIIWLQSKDTDKK